MESKLVLLTLGRESYSLVSEIEKLTNDFELTIRKRDLEIRFLQDKIAFYEENQSVMFSENQVCQKLKYNLEKMNEYLVSANRQNPPERGVSLKPSSRRTRGIMPLDPLIRSKSAPSNGLRSSISRSSSNQSNKSNKSLRSNQSLRPSNYRSPIQAWK